MDDREALRRIATITKDEASTRFVEGSWAADQVLIVLGECGFTFTENRGKIAFRDTREDTSSPDD